MKVSSRCLHLPPNPCGATARTQLDCVNMPGSAVVDIRNSYGAIFVALLVNHILFGLEIAQVWIYYRHYWNKDRKAFKFFIAFLIVMDAISLILAAYAIYWYLVSNFDNVDKLAVRLWAINFQPLFSAIPSCSVQLYYARRAYLVSGSIICPIIVVPFILSGAFLGFFFPIKALTRHEVSTSIWVPCVLMGTTVFTDIVISTTMCWSLYRKRTGFAKTDSMIMTLMTYTINSGLVFSTLGTAMTISLAVAPSSLIWLGIYWVASKCYINSLLAMLNTRDYVRGRSTTDNPDSAYNLSSIRFEPPSRSKSKSRQPGVTVTVHRSTASDFAQTKSDHTVTPGQTLEDPKPGDVEL